MEQGYAIEESVNRETDYVLGPGLPGKILLILFNRLIVRIYGLGRNFHCKIEKSARGEGKEKNTFSF